MCNMKSSRFSANPEIPSERRRNRKIDEIA
jgi:hypothetical protein